MKFKAREVDKNTFSKMRKEASEVFEGEELQKHLDRIKEIEEQVIKSKATIDKINEDHEKAAKMRAGYRKRILLFRILSLTAFLSMLILAKIASNLNPYLLLAVFLCIYSVMANTFLKCPACGYKMDMSPRDSSKHHCKRCSMFFHL